MTRGPSKATIARIRAEAAERPGACVGWPEGTPRPPDVGPSWFMEHTIWGQRQAQGFAGRRKEGRAA